MDSPYTSVFPSENEDKVAYSEGCAGCQVVAKLAAPSPLHLGLVRLLSGLLTDTADLCRIRPVLCATVLNLLAEPCRPRGHWLCSLPAPTLGRRLHRAMLPIMASMGSLPFLGSDFLK